MSQQQHEEEWMCTTTTTTTNNGWHQYRRNTRRGQGSCSIIDVTRHYDMEDALLPRHSMYATHPPLPLSAISLASVARTAACVSARPTRSRTSYKHTVSTCHVHSTAAPAGRPRSRPCLLTSLFKIHFSLPFVCDAVRAWLCMHSTCDTCHTTQSHITSSHHTVRVR